MFGAILGGLGGVVGSIFGGIANNKALKKANKAQIAGINAGIGEQRRQFDLTRSDFAPYLNTGTAALGDFGDLIGLNGPEAQQAALAVIQGSPLMGRMVEQGTEGILQNASATGGLRGGNTQRGLADFRADVFNQILQQHLGQLGGLAAAGQGAAGSLGTFGANTANQISSGLTSIGNARHGSILGRAQNWNNVGNQISSIIGSIMGMPGGMGGGLPVRGG